MFQSSRPVAGARIIYKPGTCRKYGRFNPRAPLPGRASRRDKRKSGPSQRVSILAPRCRGAHPAGSTLICILMVVSILAPRCRGAHRKSKMATRKSRTSFNPRAPLPGRASMQLLLKGRSEVVSILAPRCRGAHHDRQFAGCRSTGFNPRAPLPGRASLCIAGETVLRVAFQSSRPVAGARIWR